MRILILMMPALFAAGTSLAEPLVDRATVLDGDTIEVAGAKVRLAGIDAPELRQTCIDGRGSTSLCGRTAAKALSAMIGQSMVTCDAEGSDGYGRTLAVCKAGGVDLNARMVETGQAMAFVKYDARYAAHGRRARASKVGLWAGTFDPPWDWRRQVAAKAQQRVEQATASADGCTIKGNISRKGERIYHLPSQLDYASTRINERDGERMFCSEEEAIAAGWRRAVR